MLISFWGRFPLVSYAKHLKSAAAAAPETYYVDTTTVRRKEWTADYISRDAFRIPKLYRTQTELEENGGDGRSSRPFI